MMVLIGEMWRGGRHADNCPPPALTTDGSLEGEHKEKRPKNKVQLCFLCYGMIIGDA